MVDHKVMPKRGQSRYVIRLKQLLLKSFDVKYNTGRVLAYVFKTSNSGVDAVQQEAYLRFLAENALDPTAFPSIMKMETEVVSMVATHLHAPPTAVGSFTSGGTESCMLAMVAARNWAKENRKDVTGRAAILIPRTGHAAFFKAAELMELRVVVVEVNTDTMLPDVKDIKDALATNKNSVIAMIGSAGSYGPGTVDPIEAMALLARQYSVWLHVDGCIGGFVLNYFRDFGLEVPQYDFGVEGVSSISLDLHKYAYCAKGASVLLYRSRELRRYAIFACAEWYGYPIFNPTLQSTKGGGPVAAAWATMHYLGDDGYRRIMRDVYDGTRALVAGISAVPGLLVLGEPKASLIAFRNVDAADFNLMHIPDLMKRRGGWVVQPVLSYGSRYAPCLHVSLNPQMKSNARLFLQHLTESVEEARGLSHFDDDVAHVRGMIRGKSRLSVDDYEALCGYVELSTTDLPKTMARVNTLLDALPPRMREDLLRHFSNDLFVHDEAVDRAQLAQLKSIVLRKVGLGLVHVATLGLLGFAARTFWLRTSPTPN
eukprot:PhM_4_TR17082/c0_g1_i1/m.58529/K01634/SGPL1, DPL1; sphinganine-1-phosphate aldolase